MRERALSAVVWAAIASTAVLGIGCGVAAPPSETASPMAPPSSVAAAPASSSPRAPATPRPGGPSQPAGAVHGSAMPSDAALIPSPTLEPSLPADLRTVATATGEGIRIRIVLERNPLVAGERNRLDVTVTNTGKDDLTWFHDGCAQPASVWGKSLVQWDPGRQLSQQGQMFKQYALGTYGGQPLPGASIRFVPEAMLGRGSYGCADIGITDIVKPGARLRQTLWWTGYTDVNRALPPTGPLRVLAYAGYYWHGTGEPANITDHAYELSLDAWVAGGAGAGQLSPGQAIDAAIADPAFASYLETQELASGREEIAWYDAATGIWEIGVMPWYETEPPRIRGFRVDGVSGAILGPLDRPWDKNLDGFP